jgi:hypothetical protein
MRLVVARPPYVKARLTVAENPARRVFGDGSGSGRSLRTNPSQVEVPLFAAKSNAFAMRAHLMFATAVPPG